MTHPNRLEVIPIVINKNTSKKVYKKLVKYLKKKEKTSVIGKVEEQGEHLEI